MGYDVLVAGWTMYFVLHSLLASRRVKEFAQRTLGSAFRFYRLGYSIISIAGLVALLVLNDAISAPYYFPPEGVMRFASLVITTFGVILIQIALRQYGLRGFLGLKAEATAFRRDGILDWIRHPIYSGLILIAIGFFLFIPKQPTLITCLFILTYIPIGMWLEEKKLVKEFGEAYLTYKQEVPALFPRWKRIIMS